MAAGLGFKDFVTGEVLTAADVDGYLMQGIWVFASAAARDAAVTSPQEGNFAFTKDTNGLWYYDGAAWVASGATGDIEGVTAGTGISGGGTSGTVTITNSMATAIDAKGDLIVGTGADTFSKLTAGTNTYVLTADSAEATGLKWAAPAGGASFVGASVTKNASQTLSNATYTAVEYQVEDFDTNAYFGANATKMTVPSGKGGKYLITCAVTFKSSSSGDRRLGIYKNGSALIYPIGIPPVSGDDTRISTSVIYNLVATDYIEIFAFQNSGGNLNLAQNATENQFTITYLGA